MGNYPPPCHGLQSLNPWGMDRIDLQRLSREELIELVLALQGPANTNGYSLQPTCAQSRMPMDRIVSGACVSFFHASHAASTISS